MLDKMFLNIIALFLVIITLSFGALFGAIYNQYQMEHGGCAELSSEPPLSCGKYIKFINKWNNHCNSCEESWLKCQVDLREYEE